MTAKAQFNADEWSKVATGPFIAGLAVIAAERGGTVRESMELARVIAAEQQADDTPELIRELLRERPDARSLMGEQHDRTPQGLQLRVHETLREAVELLQQKAEPAEVEAYKQLCLEIGQRVAERTKSGGVLGIGGERVSGDEQAALEELRATLGVDAPPPGP